MNVTSKIDVNFQRPTANAVHAKQGDSLTRKISISLFSGNERFLLGEGITVAIKYSKPDKTKGFYDTLPDNSPAWAYDVGNNVLDITLAPQVLTVAGTVKVSVMLVNGEEILSTFAFDVLVEKSENFSGESEDYVNFPSLDKISNDILRLESDLMKVEAKTVKILKCTSTDGILYTAVDSTMPEIVAGSSGTHRGKGTQIVFIPDEVNTAAPMLKINDGLPIEIRVRTVASSSEVTTPISAGTLHRGMPYTLTFCGKYWLLDSYIPTDSGVNETQLKEAVNTALQEAKESGAFDGKTPVKGEDYFTEEDKAEFVNDVLYALPTWEGGSY